MAGPVFHLQPMGRLGNQMIEYMVALKFADMVGDCRLSNISVPAWNIDHPALDSPGPVAVEQGEQHIDLPALADRVRSGRINRVEWTGFGQRLENFLDRDRYQNVFRSPFETAMGFGPDYLVCPIRAEDVLHGPNPDYALTPMEFYRDVTAMTGLRPVFIGQTEPNAYMDRIRAAFPEAIYRPPQCHPLIDFETIRQSCHLAIGVSTYAWLAAWLSRTAETIHLAVNGLFNPMQKPEVDLLPFGDARFRFWLFPINHAVPLSQHAELHRRIAPYWRLMSHAALRQQFAAAPRFPRELEQALAVFDEAFYLETNADVAAVGRTHGPGSPARTMLGMDFRSDACRCVSTRGGMPANTRWRRSRWRKATTPSSHTITWLSARRAAIVPFPVGSEPAATAGAGPILTSKRQPAYTPAAGWRA